MKVLCVDGPKRGSAIDVDEGAKVWLVPIPRALTLMSIAEEGQCVPNFDTAVYNIRLMEIFGSLVMIGTVRVGNPNSYDLLDSMLTSEALSAVKK